MNKIITFFKPYLNLVFLFIISGIILKLYEFLFYFFKINNISGITIFESFFVIIIVFSLYSILILPIYTVLSFINKKFSLIFSSLLLAIAFLLELGLTIYTQQTGLFMGSDLISRPVSEVMITLKGSSNMILNIVLVVLIISFFVFFTIWLNKKNYFKRVFYFIITISIVFFSSISTIFLKTITIDNTQKNIVSKSWKFFESIIYYEGSDKEDYDIQVEFNEKYLSDFIEITGKKEHINIEYPLERNSSEIADILLPYFDKFEKTPNIVLIIVESLGRDFFGDFSEKTSFTTFLDSLALNGLYWENCLSTSSRSFAWPPSTLASAPHGKRGFQYGNMPKHYSLFSILKNNNYSTNYFYGGDTNFDRQYDFLVAQEVDYIANFLPQMKNFKKNKQANWWGLYDEVLFDESLKYLETIDNTKPQFNVFYTLSNHWPLSTDNEDIKKHFEKKTEEIIKQLTEEKQQIYYPHKDRIASLVYSDYCVENFIKQYVSKKDNKNTIFIITGDHSPGLITNNILSNYRVPLIIWSPYLKNKNKFSNIVSHFSIAPTIISFLQNNYKINVPDKIAWLSDGLDTTALTKERILFLDYDRKVSSMVMNNYFYHGKTIWTSPYLCKIEDNLTLKKIEDTILINEYAYKFDIFKYVNNYVYYNDKLLNIDKKEKYNKIFTYKYDDKILCISPDKKPSERGVDKFNIFPTYYIKNNEYKNIKITLNADISVNKKLWIEQYMRINFNCFGSIYKEIITKFIQDDNIQENKIYKISITKEFPLKDVEDLSSSIYVTTSENDVEWDPDLIITISNIQVKILGKK